MQRGRALDKIIAILAGIAIWVYVIGVKDPVSTTTIKAVPVQLVNVEAMQNAGLAIAGSGEYTVDVVVGGNRSSLNAATASDFIATADVAGMRVGQNYITVEVESPSNLTVNEIRTQKIQVYVDVAVAQETNMRIFTANLPEGCELGSIEASTSQVIVSGAKSLVDTVTDVQATIDTQNRNIDETTTEDIELIPVNADGNRVYGVKLSQNAVTIKSTLYQTKEVALNVPLVGELNEHVKLRSEIVPASVVIKGLSQDLADIWQIDAESIDKASVSESCSIPLNLIMPDGVEIAHSSRNLTVDYEVLGRVDKNIGFTNEDIEFKGLGHKLEASISEDVNLSFSVFADEVENFGKENVKLVIDIPEGTETEYDLPISVEFIDAEGVLVNDDLESKLFHVTVTEKTE